MDETAVIEYVELWATASADPALSEDDILAILAQCRIPDSDGLPPIDADYTPTYWAQLAVAKAWELKAARAALWTDVTVEGATVPASKAAEAMRNEARKWRRRCSASVRVS